MFEYLLGNQQGFNPARAAADGMTLAELSRRRQMGQEEDQFKQLDRQADMIANQAFARIRQGGDPQGVFAELAQNGGEAGALAIRKLATGMDAQRKADADYRHKESETFKNTATAEKDRAGVADGRTNQWRTVATAVATGQVPVNESTQAMLYETARSTLTPQALATMPADPAKLREWVMVMLDPKVAGDVTRDLATAKKTDLEREQMPEKLRLDQQNSGSQRISANAAASNAGTSAARLGFDKSKDARDQANPGRGQAAPSGYRFTANGELEPIPGGPAGAGKAAPEAYSKQVGGITNLQTAIAEYQDALKNFGTMDFLSPDGRAKMGTKYNNMMLQAKEAYNLGVLNGPDYSILQSVVKDPTSASGLITSNAAMSQQASELGRIMEKNKANLEGVYKQKPSAPAGNRDDLVKQALDAISKGADPAKVKARLQEMGVTDARL